MSTELLDLDEALTFLDEVVAKSPVEKVPTKQQWKTPPSPEPQQRVSSYIWKAISFTEFCNDALAF